MNFNILPEACRVRDAALRFSRVSLNIAQSDLGVEENPLLRRLATAINIFHYWIIFLTVEGLDWLTFFLDGQQCLLLWDHCWCLSSSAPYYSFSQSHRCSSHIRNIILTALNAVHKSATHFPSTLAFLHCFCEHRYCFYAYCTTKDICYCVCLSELNSTKQFVLLSARILHFSFTFLNTVCSVFSKNYFKLFCF